MVRFSNPLIPAVKTTGVLLPASIGGMLTKRLQPQLENTSYALAALTAGGGIMGYVRTRSVPSIIAGTAVGVLCMYLPFHQPSFLRDRMVHHNFNAT